LNHVHPKFTTTNENAGFLRKTAMNVTRPSAHPRDRERWGKVGGGVSHESSILRLEVQGGYGQGRYSFLSLSLLVN
jgi:hypothetical protein